MFLLTWIELPPRYGMQVRSDRTKKDADVCWHPFLMGCGSLDGRVEDRHIEDRR